MHIYVFSLPRSKVAPTGHDYNMDTPVTFRVLFVVGNPLAVVPLHCTTVPFSLAVAVNVRVEVMSATVPLATVVGLVRFA